MNWNEEPRDYSWLSICEEQISENRISSIPSLVDLLVIHQTIKSRPSRRFQISLHKRLLRLLHFSASLNSKSFNSETWLHWKPPPCMIGERRKKVQPAQSRESERESTTFLRRGINWKRNYVTATTPKRDVLGNKRSKSIKQENLLQIFGFLLRSRLLGFFFGWKSLSFM